MPPPPGDRRAFGCAGIGGDRGTRCAGTQWRAAVANARAATTSAKEATANAARAVKNEEEAVKRGNELERSNRKLRLTGYASALQLAQREWELGNVPRVRTLLNSLKPPTGEDDIRGFEWHYLRRQFDDPPETLKFPDGLLRHPYFGQIERLEISPNGARLLAVSSGHLLAWEIPGGRAVSLLKNSSRAIIDARFSPDGKWLGVLAVNLPPEQYVLPTGRVRDSSAFLEIWDLAGAERLRATELGRGYEGGLAFRPDRRQVAVRVDESEGQKSSSRVLIVNAEDGRVIRTLIEGEWINEALAYSPDGSLLVGPGPEGKLNVWDAETGKVVRTIDPKEVSLRDAAFRPDGTRLAVVGDSGKATIWSVPGWELLQSLRVGEQNPMRCRYSCDGKSLATQGSNWIKIWDGGTGEYRFLIRGAGSDLAFTPDGARIAAAGDAGTVRFWDARQEQGALVHKAKESLYNASFSHDGRRVLDALGTVLDAATGAVVGTIPAPSGQAIRETARRTQTVTARWPHGTQARRRTPSLASSCSGTSTRAANSRSSTACRLAAWT